MQPPYPTGFVECWRGILNKKPHFHTIISKLLFALVVPVYILYVHYVSYVYI